MYVYLCWFLPLYVLMIHNNFLHRIGMYLYMVYCRPYDVDEGVQLVCKYLRAYDYRSNLKKGINKLYNDNSKLLLLTFMFTIFY